MLQSYAQTNAQGAEYRIRPAAQRPAAERIAHLEQRIAESLEYFGECNGVRQMRAQLEAIRAGNR